MTGIRVLVAAEESSNENVYPLCGITHMAVGLKYILLNVHEAQASATNATTHPVIPLLQK